MNVTFYDTIEEMLDDLSQAMRKADDNTQKWQKAIKKGDCFWQETEHGFNIYGKVLKNAYREKRLKNYRFCKCFSEACPEGERGDVHVSSISGILSREEFEEKIQAL